MLRNTSIKVFAMKKYLIVGALALVAGLFVASCTHDDDIYNGSVVEQKQEAFQKAFVSAFGQINATQNWGFYEEDLTALLPNGGIAPARTRFVDVNSNEWVQKGNTLPSDITDREREVVMGWFRSNRYPKSETVDLHNYFIQNVGYTDVTYKAGPDNNGHDVYIENPGRTHMDWIFCGPGNQPKDWNNPFNSGYNRYTWDDGDEHINNFNAYSGEIQHILYTGSEYFGFHDSNTTGYSTDGKSEKKYCAKERNFVIRFIDVDGVIGCYVGFDYETGKTTEKWHLDPDGYFSDRVIKLIPAEGGMTEVKYREEVDEVKGTPGRIFCEDLGDVSYNDIDYNDVVFDAQIITRETRWYMDTYVFGKKYSTVEVNDALHPYSLKNYAKITLLAAGGTMPVTVAGVEVHDAFGVGHTTMVNTVTEKTGSLNGAPYVQRDYVELGEFEGYSRIQDIPIKVQYSNDVLELEAIPGKAPHKILVLAAYKDKDGEHAGTDWTSERCNLGDAYPDFKDYVASPKVDQSGDFVYDENGNLEFVGGQPFSGASFWDNSNSAYLFGSWQPASCGEARYTVTTTINTDGVTEMVLYANDEGYDISSPLYFMDRALLKNQKIKENDVIRIYGDEKTAGTDWLLILNDGNSKALHRAGTNNEGTWKGYVDIYLTAEMATALTTNIENCAMIISGTNIMVTRVSLIKN